MWIQAASFETKKSERIKDCEWTLIDERLSLSIRKYAFTVNFLLQSKGRDQTLFSSTFVQENNTPPKKKEKNMKDPNDLYHLNAEGHL